MERSEPDFQSIFEAAPGAYLVLAPDLTIVAVSEAYLRATMTVRAAIVGRGIFDVFPDNPDDPAATGVANLRSSLERVKSLGRPDAMAVQKYDIARPVAEGGGFEVRYWSPVNTPVLGLAEEVRYIVHRVEDVTDFVRMRERSREEDRTAEELRTHAGQMEAEVHRRAQEIQEANRLLRAAQEELEATVLSRTEDLEKAMEALRRSEDQLRQSQKMDAVGRLAGGIAHDFNNLLTVILSYSDLAYSALPSEDPVRADVDEIRRSGSRAAELTRQLLAFSRQQVLDLRTLDLNDVVTQASKMLMRMLGEDVELKVVLARGLAKVKADAGQVEQALMNLAVNARDAMPGGGKLTIETAGVDLDDEYAREHLGVTPGHHVMVAVTDTGAGMDQATQGRIFEPFFTTKEVGRGTGLGLATVFGIIKQTGGTIWVDSEPGSGTTFKLFFPKAEGVADGPRRSVTPFTDPRGNETILLVEDEPHVRAVAAGILKRAGYHVIEASGPGEALLASEQHRGRIHLLLTDVVMPNMNGRRLADRITAARPDTRAVFMSGYTDNIVLHHGVVDSGAFLQKPFTPASLTAKVREALDSTKLLLRS